MRRLFSLFLVIALLAGCSKSEPDNPIPEKPKQESVTLSSGPNAAPVIATAGGSTSVSFTASSSWSASIINTKADSWCSVSPTSGGAGAATITITVKENTTPDNRSASVVIKAGTATQTIKVEQKQQDALTVTASSFEVPAEGGEIKVTAKSNVSFTHTISTDAQKWIKAVETKALKDSTLIFEILKNDGVANRSGQIFLASGNLKDTVNVYQAGETPTIVVSKDEYVLKSEGESFEVEVASNVNATMSLIFPQGVGAWIGENTTRAVSTNKFYLTAQANETYDSRTALLVFSNAENNLADTVTVTQAQKDAIVVAKSSYNVDNSGGTIEIEVGHNIDYECSISADWITRAETKAMETDKLHFNVAENAGYDNREGVITFTAGGGTIKQDVKVYQSEKGALIISKKDHVTNDAGGELTLEIKANVEFSVTEPTVDWLHNITTKGLQTHTLKYVVDANETYDSRTTQLYVKNLKTGTQDTLTVTQMQKDAIVLAKSEYEFDAEGGSLDFEIQTNVDVTVSIPDSCSSWIRQVGTRGLEAKKLFFDVLPADSVSREGKIILTGGGVTQAVKVLQICTVKLDPAAIPDNEIWYVMSDGTTYDVYLTTKQYGHQPFDAKVISNTYKNGYGIIKFDAPVTKINDHTFGNFWAANMTELYLPDCIEYLGTGAIHHTGLTTLHIPKNLKIVGSYGLNNPNLESFTGSHITEDGRCVIIEDGFMPNYGDTQTPVKNYMAAFAPAGITEYTLPNNVEILGWYTFAWCPELRKITFNEGLKTIMGDCFVNAHLDCEIILPSTLETLDPYAFHSCSGIKGFYGNEKFHTSDHLCLIFEQTDFCEEPEKNGKWINRFVGYDITDYSIPEGIKGIENYSFDQMPNLKTVTLPSSIVEVGAYAFNHCDNLEALYGECVSNDHKAIVFDTQFRKLVITKGVVNYTIPDEITSIGYCAFTESPEIETITMGDQITHIEGYAFSDCPNLQTITLSAGLKNLSGYNAFLNSRKLESIYCRALVPPSYYDNQMSEFPNLKFYVPEQSLTLYQNNAGWSLYRKYFVGYKYDDLGEYDYYISSDFSQNGTTTTLQTASKGNGIDIVLMGDAYSDRQIADGTYKADMENLYNNLFTEEPYKSFKDHFNVYYVNVVSVTEGYEHGGAALGGYFGNGTLVGGNDNAVFDYALNAISEEKMDEALLVVAMNSDNYAGTCYMYNPEGGSDYGSGVSVSYFPKGGDAGTFAQLIHHEACGHGFAKLADEYAYEDMGAVSSDYVAQTKSQQNNWGWWKNVDFTNDPAQVRWAKFLEDSRYANDGLGVFEGGLTYWNGVWRPTENSIMRYNTGGFNAPSREAIYYRIHKLAYGTEWVYDYEKFVEYDALSRDASTAASTKSPSVVHYKPLHPPVVHNKSWRDAKKEN